MSDLADCPQNTNPLKLVREGTAQVARSPKALDPAYVSVNERGVAHNLVFAQNYAALLKYFDLTGAAVGDWTPFFNSDVSALLAVPAIEDIEEYTSNTQSWFDYLNEMENQSKTAELKDRFGYLYGSVASLARRLDGLTQALPGDAPLRGTLQNLIQTQLAPAFKRLIAYYKGGVGFSLVNAVAPPVQILRAKAVRFDAVLNAGPAAALSSDWSEGQAWAAYASGITKDESVYGPAASVFVRINHCSTHTLFKSGFDQFLKVFARTVGDAKQALDDTLTKNDTHEPHYALFLAFLRLLESARSSGNTLTQRHLDFYYRTILGLKEKSAEPGHAHLLAELAKQTSRDFKPGELFKAGKDQSGKDAFFANTADFVANQAKVTARKTLYRHGGECVGGSMLHKGRLFASPAADSDDGLGAPLTSADGSWHPFFNKIYTDGALTEIRMPEAQIGFAVASHYLLLAGGSRWIVAVLTVSGYSGPVADALRSSSDQVNFSSDITCHVTTEKGWLDKQPLFFGPAAADTFYVAIEIGGGDPPIVPYSAKVHGYSFQTDQPVLLVTLNQDDTRGYVYSSFQSVAVSSITMTVYVNNLKSLAASNDFGPLDTSKPFQPFSTSPVAGSSLIIGSKEIFQKKLSYVSINMDWLIAPTVYPPTGTLPNIAVDVLSAGEWSTTSIAPLPVNNITYYLTSDLDKPVVDEPDFTPNAFYNTQSRSGFVKLRLTGNFGQDSYQTDLIKYLRKDPATATTPGSKPPTGPTARSLSVDYAAETALVLNTANKDSYENRPSQFFHLTPFGAAEQHPYLNGKGQVYLFPQFEFERADGNAKQLFTSEAEFYIGVTGLVPPQNLSLLFQVVDGTANPLAEKPEPHVDWAYLKQNEWVEFDKSEVQDTTDEMLKSGIVTLSVPRDATNNNTALPGGMFWIRAAMHDTSDAVCRLQLVAAQAMEAVFADRGNAPEFSATPLPAGTISKLDTPDSAVKSIAQPFPSFGGRGAEQSQAFFTRISERLRHKNRAIELWDYERLILEAFPEIYKVKCLNHTFYESSESVAEGCGNTADACTSGIYRELAPGHVTIVAIPNLQTQNLRDPLKPFASLGLLEDIKAVLEERTSCFVQLHVKNPQFEEVRVRFSLRLYDGFDETYYPNLLKQAITRFLSPWAFAGGGMPSFGGKIYKSVLINFVEDQPYVDYVTDFQLFHDLCGKPGTVDLDEVEGARAVSVLVSVPATKHEIALIKPAQDAPLGETCLCDA